MRSINSFINNPSCRSEAKNRRCAGGEQTFFFFSSVSGCSSLSASIFPTLLVSNAPPPSHLLVWSQCGCLHSADVTNMSVIPAACYIPLLSPRTVLIFFPPPQHLFLRVSSAAASFYLLRLKEKSSVPP